MVKMDPTKVVPPGTNFLINENPWNLFFCKIWTLSEKLDHLSEMKEHRSLNTFHLHILN